MHRYALTLIAGLMPLAASGQDATDPRCKAAELATVRPAAGSRDGGPGGDPAGAPAGCDAYALYYGRAGRAGAKPDPKAALACATRVAAAAEPDPQAGGLDGIGILATIYANGAGIPRDLDRAAAYVCRMDVAEGERTGMLDTLTRMRGDGSAAPFRVCDHTTSTPLALACFERADADRTALDEDAFADLRAPLKEPAAAAFDRLRKAASTFAGAIANHEVDRTGTAAPVLALQAERKETDAFVALLRAAADGTVRADRPLAEADRALNAAYARAMGRRGGHVSGTVDKDDVRATQRAWLAYRDAFAAFAARAVPAMPADALKAALTERRTRQLLDLAGA